MCCMIRFRFDFLNKITIWYINEKWCIFIWHTLYNERFIYIVYTESFYICSRIEKITFVSYTIIQWLGIHFSCRLNFYMADDPMCNINYTRNIRHNNTNISERFFLSNKHSLATSQVKDLKPIVFIVISYRTRLVGILQWHTYNSFKVWVKISRKKKEKLRNSKTPHHITPISTKSSEITQGKFFHFNTLDFLVMFIDATIIQQANFYAKLTSLPFLFRTNNTLYELPCCQFKYSQKDFMCTGITEKIVWANMGVSYGRSIVNVTLLRLAYG